MAEHKLDKICKDKGWWWQYTQRTHTCGKADQKMHMITVFDSYNQVIVERRIYNGEQRDDKRLVVIGKCLIALEVMGTQRFSRRE